MKKIILPIIILAIVATSCKKDKEDEPKVYAEENFYSKFLAQTGFNQKTDNSSGTEFWELGYTFKPMVKGRINSLILNLFNNVPSVRITIWDATTKAILLTETATNVLANTEKKISITPFILEKDKAYVISMNTKFYFKKSKNDFSSVVYPITIGNISVLRNNFRPTNSELYPVNENSNFIYGDLSFMFQQTP